MKFVSELMKHPLELSYIRISIFRSIGSSDQNLLKKNTNSDLDQNFDFTYHLFAHNFRTAQLNLKTIIPIDRSFNRNYKLKS